MSQITRKSKTVRQSKKRLALNRVQLSALNSLIKKFRVLCEDKAATAEQKETLYRQVICRLAQAGAKNLIHRNAAVRAMSRLERIRNCGLPKVLEGKLHYANFVDYEADWPETNRRRGTLIDKDIAGTLSDAERTELDGLQAYADYHLEQVAPRPTDELKQLEDLMLATSIPSIRGE